MTLRKTLSALLLLSLLAACDKSTPAPKPEAPGAPTASTPTTPPVGSTGGRTQIALIPRDAAHAQELQAGAEKALAEGKKGPDGKPTMDLLVQTPDKSSQPELAESLLKSGVAAIIIAPDSQKSLDAVTTAAGGAGRTPVIAIDTDLNTAACKSTITSATPNYEGLGYTALKTASDAIREKKIEKTIILPAKE